MPQIFAILNISPDSFSDGGLYGSVQEAIERVKILLAKSVYAVDVGAVSTRPNAVAVDVDEEIARLGQSLPQIIKVVKTGGAKISLDSFNYKTICYGVDAGIDIINDVNALKDERFIDVLASNLHLDIVFMHSLAVPADKNIVMQQNNYELLIEIANYASIKIAKMLDRGIALGRIIFDPGIGFGKNSWQGLYIMQNLFALKQMIRQNLGLKTTTEIQILIGHSRKSILRDLSGYTLTNNKDADNKTLDALTTLTTNILLQNPSCNFVRVH